MHIPHLSHSDQKDRESSENHGGARSSGSHERPAIHHLKYRSGLAVTPIVKGERRR